MQDGRPDGGYRYFDNCQNLPNADQLDTDNDGLGKCTIPLLCTAI